MSEEDIPSKLSDAKRLTLAYRELHEVPEPVVAKFAAVARELDLSGNQLTDLSAVRHFSKLEVLILDGNRITSHTPIPSLPLLHTLWVNKNKIDNLSLFLDKIVQSCPNVKFLSMLMNDACPNYFNGGTPSQYQDYRYYVINRLRNLTHLDDSKITEEEKKQAIKKYGSLEVLVARDDKEKKEIEEKRRQQAEEKKRRQEAAAKKRVQEEKERRRARRRMQNTTEQVVPPLPPDVQPKESPKPPAPKSVSSGDGLMGELARRLGGIDLPAVDDNLGSSSSSSSTATRVLSPQKAKEDDSYKWSSSDDEGDAVIGQEDDMNDWTDDEEVDPAVQQYL